MARVINLDHASGTKIDKKVIQTMNRYTSKSCGNASSEHQIGRKARRELENARKQVAHILNCKTQEVLFLNTGTTANNITVLGVLKKKGVKLEIVISNIEHSSIKKTCEALDKKFTVLKTLKVNKNSKIDKKQLQETITKNTKLVSIIYANNETGVIQDIKEITEIIKEKNSQTLVHTDACQAAEFLNLNTQELGVDLMTLSGSKIYGPKSTSVLFKKEEVDLNPSLFGGNQEQGLFPGTEDIASVLGFVKALELITRVKEKEKRRQQKLQKFLLKEIKNQFPNVHINTDIKESIPNKLHISIPNAKTNEVIAYFDQNNICVSGGSACESGSINPSHVMKALYKNPEKFAHIRISSSKYTKKKELKTFLKVLQKYFHTEI